MMLRISLHFKNSRVKAVLLDNCDNIRFNNCYISENGNDQDDGSAIFGLNTTFIIENSRVYGNLGNVSGGILSVTNSNNVRSLTINNCLIVGNKSTYYGPLYNTAANSNINTININNTTIAGNNLYGLYNATTETGVVNSTIKNSIIRYNENGVTGGNISASYSLIKGINTGTGMLNSDVVDPQFVNAVGFASAPTEAGDYRLKWCSLLIDAGTNTGISPLDLDRTPRNFNGTADMGAFEYLGNKPSQTNNSTISGTIDVPFYAGGAIQTITSTAKILAPAGAIDFKAPNSITLSPGFEARGMSSYFKAQIGANVSCTN